MFKKLLLSISMLSLILSPKCFSMGFTTTEQTAKHAAKFMENLAREAEYMARKRREAQERKANLRREWYEAKIRNATTDAEKARAQKAYYKFEADQQKAEEKIDDFAFGIGREAFGVAFDAVKEEIHAKNRLNEEAVKAKFAKDASVKNTKQYINALTNPKNAKLLVLTAGGIFAAWHASKLAAKVVDKYIERIPTLAEETSLVGMKDKVINYLTNQKLESNISDVILEPDLANKIERLASSVKNTVKNNGYFRHTLFYGPPGTGKTMLAKRIARSSGLEYIYFAGSSLDQFSVEEALINLVELFEFAKRSSKKLMIIIDEAEILFANRANNKLSEKTRKMLNLMLTYSGTETTNFLIVALTNRPQDLDDAFLNRCDEQIKIGTPGPEQREKILELYINKLLIERTKVQVKPGLFSRLFNRANNFKQITIEKDVFSKERIESIANKLDNFVGRDISKLVIAMQSEANATSNACLTKEIVDRIVQEKIEQKAQELKKFGF